MTRSIIVMLTGLFLQFGSVAAEDTLSLSIERAIDLGLAHSKVLSSSRLKARAAAADKKEALTHILPSLSMTAGYTRLSDVPPFEVSLPAIPGIPESFTISPTIQNNYSVAFQLNQPIFTGFALSSTYKMTSEYANAAGIDARRDRTDVEYGIRVAYWNLYLARETERIVTESVSTVAMHLQDAENMFEQGLITRNDVLKVQTELSRVELREIEARNAAQIAAVNLAILIDFDRDARIEVASNPDLAEYQDIQLDSLISRGLAKRPETAATMSRLHAAEHGIRAAKSGWYPRLMFSGNYYFMRPNPRILQTRDDWEDTWDVGIYLSFDLWNWGATRYAQQKALAAENMARNAMSQIEDAIELEISRAYLDTRRAYQSVDVARTGITQAEENFDLSRDMFQTGLATSSNLLDAEIALEQAELDLSRSLVDCILARARLIKSIGE
jgi:outer membrane protein